MLHQKRIADIFFYLRVNDTQSIFASGMLLFFTTETFDFFLLYYSLMQPFTADYILRLTEPYRKKRLNTLWIFPNKNRTKIKMYFSHKVTISQKPITHSALKIELNGFPPSRKTLLNTTNKHSARYNDADLSWLIFPSDADTDTIDVWGIKIEEWR